MQSSEVSDMISARRESRESRVERWGWRAAIGAVCAVGWLLGFALTTLPCDANAQTLDADASEQLVRPLWFEGLPEAEAARIGPEGAARLIEMLQDPNERRSHANILVALGLSAQPGAFEAICEWADAPRDGEIDRDTFRAWQALPFAFGHLARRDRRALGRLEGQLGGTAPRWRFRHHRGARLERQARRTAARSLAMTGLPEARGALDRAGRDVSDPDFGDHLERMRALHEDRARRGRR